MIDGMIMNGLQGDGAIQSYLNEGAQPGNGLPDRRRHRRFADRRREDQPGARRKAATASADRSSRATRAARSAERQPARRFSPRNGVTSRGQDRHLQRHQLHASADRSRRTRSGSSGRAGSSPSTSRSRNTYVSDGTTAGIAACATRSQAAAARCARRASTRSISTAASARLTWQISPRNKLSGYYDRIHKVRGAAMSPGRRPDDLVGASGIRRSTRPNTIKWTSTVSSKLLIEGGYLEQHRALQQPVPAEGIEKPYGSPGVVRDGAARVDNRRGSTNGPRPPLQYRQLPGSLQRAGVGVVRHRHAQHQGRVPGFVGCRSTTTCARTRTSIRTT